MAVDTQGRSAPAPSEPPPDRAAGAGRGARGLAPYLLTLPGVAWLVAFFAAPLGFMFLFTFYDGTIDIGYSFTPDWPQTYVDAFTTYDTQIIRSAIYALIVTVATLLISFPMMYWIAMKGGRRKNLFVLLLLLPFFTPFLIRTLAWQLVLSDQGIFLGTLKDIGLLSADFKLLASPLAVISGMTYNFLPFMALPLYVALEKLDPSLLDAAADLYSSKREAFLKVTLPLTMPGVFAGSLLTFIPSIGDFIDAEILGNPNTTMIGSIIRRQLLVNQDYPTGAALSFLLIAGILVGVFFYARALGTEELTG
ncbi:MAG: ABC transporter permease [Actinomycetota bacterium]|nr:ABC transporter permease [Actinomycetota bacterium]